MSNVSRYEVAKKAAYPGKNEPCLGLEHLQPVHMSKGCQLRSVLNTLVGHVQRSSTTLRNDRRPVRWSIGLVMMSSVIQQAKSIKFTGVYRLATDG